MPFRKSWIYVYPRIFLKITMYGYCLSSHMTECSSCVQGVNSLTKIWNATTCVNPYIDRKLNSTFPDHCN